MKIPHGTQKTNTIVQLRPAFILLNCIFRLSIAEKLKLFSGKKPSSQSRDAETVTKATGTAKARRQAQASRYQTQVCFFSRYLAHGSTMDCIAVHT